MNIDKLRELLAQVQGRAQEPEMRSLFDALRTFIELYSQRNEEYAKTPEFAQKVKDAYLGMRDGLETVARRYGMNLEALQQYMINPEHFTADQWRDMQSAKACVRAEPPARPFHKKLKKSNQKLRV